MDAVGELARDAIDRGKCSSALAAAMRRAPDRTLQQFGPAPGPGAPGTSSSSAARSATGSLAR